MMTRGLFITFEGIEGSGKSTQLRRAAAWLAERGHRVVTTREPGGTREGEAIRTMLLDPTSELGSEAELFLYLADRAETMRQVIEPALAMGAVVLGDRHTDATLAYQGAMRGIGVERARDLNALATLGRRPDLTLLFDLDARRRTPACRRSPRRRGARSA
jgi:dTMP kinase